MALAGCAAKNPLMQEPSASTAASRSAEAKSDAASPASTTSATAGVQRTEGNRFLNFFKPYKMDVHQGNFVSQEMVAQLKEGMTPAQVMFVLGTPLLNDIFHKDRWDYAFRLQKGNGEILSSRVTVYFANNRLQRFEGGNLPTEQDFLTLIVSAPPVAK